MFPLLRLILIHLENRVFNICSPIITRPKPRVKVETPKTDKAEEKTEDKTETPAEAEDAEMPELTEATVEEVSEDAKMETAPDDVD